MAVVKYRDGDWFAVPLRRGGFGIGLIARSNPRGVQLGYFFGPRHRELPALADVAGLEPADAVLIGHFGHLGIRGGMWPILGRSDGWDRAEWPSPPLVRYEELTGRSFKVYDDDDPNKFLREEQIPPGTAEQGPKDGMKGAGFVELILTDLLP